MWNGTAWSHRVTGGPSPRHRHAMTFDPYRNVTVLYGGQTGSINSPVFDDETWEWNGAAWVQRPLRGPPGREAHAMAYDTARQTIVLFGGFDRFAANGQSWGLFLSCYANCDGSTIIPVLNVNDFVCFLNKFAAGDPYANCDGSTTAPMLNVLDFTCFLNWFAAGCS